MHRGAGFQAWRAMTEFWNPMAATVAQDYELLHATQMRALK